MSAAVPPRIVDTVRRWGRAASSFQTLTPEFRHWTGPGGAVVAWVPVRSRPVGPAVWMAAGEPMGPPDALERAARAFDAAASAAGARALWFGVEQPERLGRGRRSVVIGAHPVWRADRWPEVMASKASLRAQVRRAANKGVRVEEWPTGAAARSSALRGVLHAWLGRRGMPALAFLANPHVLDHLVDRRVFVARRGAGRAPEGYLILAPIPARDGWLAEWLIRSPGSPNGTSALLLDAAIRALDGASTVTLGLVALSTYAPLSPEAPPGAVRALLAWTRTHSRRFYNFEGLERFKAKFLPDAWEPVYLVTDGRPVTLGTVYAVADAFAGRRSPLRLVGRALADAAADEVRAAPRALSWLGKRTWPASSD